MKTVIDPRMLENILSSIDFPCITGWEMWMLRRRNSYKYVFFKTKRHNHLWDRILLMCILFESYFCFDPRDQKCSYEYLLEEACLCLQRRAYVVVEKQDEDMRSGILANQQNSASNIYRFKFGLYYDVAVQFFGHDLTKSQGFKPFFDRAEAQLKKSKNSHNTPERVR